MFNIFRNRELEEMRREINSLNSKINQMTRARKPDSFDKKKALKERIMIEGSLKIKDETVVINIPQYNAIIDLIIAYYLDGSNIDGEALKKELTALKIKRKVKDATRHNKG